MYFKTFSTIASILLLAATPLATAQEQPRELSGAEVRKTFIGNTMDSDNAYLYFAPDGVLLGQAKASGATDEGKYRINDDGVWCREWSRWRGGSEECQRVKKLGDTYGSVRLNGTVKLLFKIRRGNAEGL